MARRRLTDRDLDILEFLTRYGAATAEQVRREFFAGSVKAAYRRLRALEERGVVKGERVFYRMPQIYRVTEPGAHLAEVDLPPARLDISRLHHSLEVLELSWLIRCREGVQVWLTERELRRDKLIERREKDSGRMKAGGKMGRMPDGLLILGDTRELAVELELTPKRATSYRRIFSDYERQIKGGELDGVLFYFSSNKAMERVREFSSRFSLNGYLQFIPYVPVFEKRR